MTIPPGVAADSGSRALSAAIIIAGTALVGRCAPVLINVRLALDLNLHAGIHQPFHLDERGGRAIVAEVGDAARVDFRTLGNVGHENLHFDDMLRSSAGCP